ncbi:hypothetical protein ACCC88_04220 [Sphingomonas sp. Sphisp140]|uniref:hypothetical protein n=1 Tax=unclassified Sphingomonas TaxID=196159 RepID=UPI0039B03F6E
MNDYLDSQMLPVACPGCGQPGHAFFGQPVIGGKLRWYRSSSCPASRNSEEDGVGWGPPNLRNELITAKGSWSVRIEEGEKAKVISTTIRLLSVPRQDAAGLLQSYPRLLIGTKAEADWLIEELAAEGIRAKATTQGANGNHHP